MFIARAAVVSIVTGEQLAVLSLPKMNKGDRVAVDDRSHTVTDVSIYKGRQIVYVNQGAPLNKDFINALSWEVDW